MLDLTNDIADLIIAFTNKVALTAESRNEEPVSSISIKVQDKDAEPVVSEAPERKELIKPADRKGAVYTVEFSDEDEAEEDTLECFPDEDEKKVPVTGPGTPVTVKQTLRNISRVYSSVPGALPIDTVDGGLRFNKETHSYLYDGLPCISVTSYISTLFPQFDAHEILNTVGIMIVGNKTPTTVWIYLPVLFENINIGFAEYYGMDPESIKAQWSSSGAEASRLGTLLHRYIEAVFRGQRLDDFDQVGDKELEQFVTFHEQAGPFPKVSPERKLVHPSLLLAGTVDLIRSGSSSNSVIIYDWKRSSKDLSPNACCFEKYCLEEGLKHLPDTQHYKYALQLNLYKYIIETAYGFVVEEMFLVQFYEDAKYLIIPVRKMEEEVKTLVKKRELTVTKKYGDLAWAKGHDI